MQSETITRAPKVVDNVEYHIKAVFVNIIKIFAFLSPIDCRVSERTPIDCRVPRSIDFGLLHKYYCILHIIPYAPGIS